MWAVNPDGSVSRIKPATGKVVERIPVQAGTALAAGKEGVWALGSEEPAVIRIDPSTNEVGQRIPLQTEDLQGLAVGAGSVWVTDLEAGVLWRIEPGPEPRTRTIDVGFGVTAVSYRGGAVWVTNFVRDEVVHVDARTNQVTARIPLAGTPPSVAATDQGAWVSVAGAPQGDTLPRSFCGPVVAGAATPDVLIASDLPLQGPTGEFTRVIADAVRFVVREHGFRAGEHTVGYQSCDNSTAQSGAFDILKCAANAKAFAATTRLVGVIGPWNSPCAWAQIPIANRAEGPLAMVSPSNTHQGLTHAAAGMDPAEPQRYYPTGIRNYFRLTAPADFDAAAAALLAKQLRLRRVYVLHAGFLGNELAPPFVRAARRLGVPIVGSATWDPEATTYDVLARRVGRARPDGVFLADELFANGAAVVEALRARLGPNVALLGTEAFGPPAELFKTAGQAAVGMYINSTAITHEGLSAAGRRFLREFSATRAGRGVPSGIYVAEAAQAAEVLLAAIARSDGSRASVVRELRRLRVENGILGSFRFDRNGDMTPTPVTVLRITGASDPRSQFPEPYRGAAFDRLVRLPATVTAAG